MESTKFFNKLSLNLKNKIYQKYKINLNEITDILKPIILKIYGKKHSDIIEKKLNQIHLINFIDINDLNIYFYNSFDTFSPKILNSENNTLQEPDETNDLLVNFDELFGDDSFKIEKIYDTDVIEYMDMASEYSLNLYNEYAKPYPNSDLPLEVFDKKFSEYQMNSSLYSCFKEEISKLNLILDSDFLYNNIQDYLFLHNSSLICNVNKDFEKADILIINPIKFDKKDIFNLICNIISSINTDLFIDDEQIFTFDRGLKDCFIKHTFNHGIENDNRNYRALIDFVNQSITFEIIAYLKDNNISILDYTDFPTLVPYPHSASVFTQFYNSYKKLILDSIITKHNSTLFDRIGEENFINFLDVSFKFVEESKRAYFYGSNYEIDNNSTLRNLYYDREKYLENMKNFKNEE